MLSPKENFLETIKKDGKPDRLVKQFEQSKKMMKQMPGLMGKGKKGGRMGGFKLPF